MGEDGSALTAADLLDLTADWSPAPVQVAETLTHSAARALLALLPPGTPPLVDDQLPMLWHHGYFVRWPPIDELGADGHPVAGGLLPPLPERRRMFAGGRCAVETPLQLGSEAVSTSEVVDRQVKSGRSGAMLVVTVLTRIVQAGRLCVVEEQDLVYRSGQAQSPAPAAVSASGTHDPQRDFGIRESRRFDSTVLFRFSAATANSHRIHYDLPYAREVERYPGLLVQGPLLALSMAELVRRHGTASRGRLEYRLHRPVFADQPVELALDSSDGRYRTAVLGADGAAHATATFTPA